jgi:hypothetical protein
MSLKSGWIITMDNIVHVESWINALLEKLTAQQRRKLLRDVATRLRQQQQKTSNSRKTLTAAHLSQENPSYERKKGESKDKCFQKCAQRGT